MLMLALHQLLNNFVKSNKMQSISDYIADFDLLLTAYDWSEQDLLNYIDNNWEYENGVSKQISS